jgi:amino acid transporter
MQQAFSWLVVIAAAATLIVLIAGVITMLRHGKASARTSNRLMRFRILFQFATIMLIGLAFLLSRH